MSNCDDCRFWGDRGCAVNPGFWAAWDKLRKSDDFYRKTIEPFLAPCPQREKPKPLTFTLTLSEMEWKFAVERKWMSPNLRAQIAESLNLPLPPKEEHDDMPF